MLSQFRAAETMQRAATKRLRNSSNRNNYFPPELWEVIASFVSLSQLPRLLVLCKQIHAILASDFVWRTRLQNLARNAIPRLSIQFAFYDTWFSTECAISTHSSSLLRVLNTSLRGEYLNSGICYIAKPVNGGVAVADLLRYRAYSYLVEFGPQTSQDLRHPLMRCVTFQKGRCFRESEGDLTTLNEFFSLRIGNLVSLVQYWPGNRDFYTAASGHILPLSRHMVGSWCDSFGQRGLCHMRFLPEGVDEILEDETGSDLRTKPEIDDLRARNWDHAVFRNVRPDFLAVDRLTVNEWAFVPFEKKEEEEEEEQCILDHHSKGLFVMKRFAIRENYYHGIGFSTQDDSKDDGRTFRIIGAVHLGWFSGFFLSNTGSRLAHFFVEMPPLEVEVVRLENLVATGLVYCQSGVVGQLKFQVGRGEHLRSYHVVLEQYEERKAAEEVEQL